MSCHSSSTTQHEIFLYHTSHNSVSRAYCCSGNSQAFLSVAVILSPVLQTAVSVVYAAMHLLCHPQPPTNLNVILVSWNKSSTSDRHSGWSLSSDVLPVGCSTVTETEQRTLPVTILFVDLQKSQHTAVPTSNFIVEDSCRNRGRKITFERPVEVTP